MPYARYFAACLVIAAAVLLTGAWNSPSSHSSHPTPSAEAGSAAVKILEEAVARLDPQRVAWLETKIWQKGRLDRFTYESEGRYLVGPDHRLRLELTTRHGDAAATSLVVCDGVTFWQGRRTGDGPWTDVGCVNLKAVLQSLQSAKEPHQVRDEFLHSYSFGGVAPLLETLRTRQTWARKETVRRDGRALIKLVGSWSDETLGSLVAADEPWPDGLPRQCRLYLDMPTLWPHRVEWWGPLKARSDDVLLLQMELRDPVLNQPLSTEPCAREFAIPVATEHACNQIPEMMERARQVLAGYSPAH